MIVLTRGLGWADTIPKVHGTTFTGVKVDLPEALQGRVGVLVLGFSQNSRAAVTVWGKRLAGDYYDSSKVMYFEMPMLASVPRIMRGFVENRIKAAVSDRGKPHFLPLTDDEDRWRALVHYGALGTPDDAYVLVVDGSGDVIWQAQGPATDDLYSGMKAQVERISAHTSAVAVHP